MITAIVQFHLPVALPLEKAEALFLKSAPQYRETPGLIRKYYLLAEDGQTAGGVYLWKCRADAERFYSDAWKAFIQEKYAAAPSVTYFHSPVIVDNLAGEIIPEF
jgi:hypothetical protein